MDTKEIFEINVRTIQMYPPVLLTNNTIKRQSKNKDEQVKNLVSFEALLRRTAYKNTIIKTDESFFNDSDMKSEYYLVVVYDAESNIPLLSARHYFDKSSIAKFLKGDNNMETELFYHNEKFNLNNYPKGKIFLADRLSGNINSSIYRKNHRKIFSLYYSEILNNNKNSTLLLMVRKVKHDKQLSKYLSMGFTILGSTIHKDKEHNIILRDLFK